MTTEEVYVVQRFWQTDSSDGEWVDYRQRITDLDRAREMLEFASGMSGFEGPWRIIHRVTAIVETVVE